MALNWGNCALQGTFGSVCRQIRLSHLGHICHLVDKARDAVMHRTAPTTMTQPQMSAVLRLSYRTDDNKGSDSEGNSEAKLIGFYS